MPTIISEVIAQMLLTGWTAARAELAEIEKSEHPDIVDPLGRIWTWKSRDIYTHDSTLAFPAEMARTSCHVPADSVLSNPNYSRLCSICLNGRTFTFRSEGE
jgi:hypothetical protein